jgi:hypothetical protein
MEKTKKLQVYQIAVTEFWRLVYRVEAEENDPSAALTMYECLAALGSLPDPQRTPLGRIEPPEFVYDESGRVLHSNPPPKDDAERMLFVELFRRQARGKNLRSVQIGMKLICEIKCWDLRELRKEVYAA